MRTIPIPPGLETELFVLEKGALSSVPAVCREIFPGCRPWLIADGNTWRAAGEKLQNILRNAGLEPLEPYLYPDRIVLHADEAWVEPLRQAMVPGALPVAVGGGTINDIVKRTSGVAGVPYCCIPTAPSVDGYTSSGAAMTVKGLKQTLPCPAPRAIVADVEVLHSAPREMAAAGYADLAAKIPAGAEWLIADTLGIEPIRQDVWDLVQVELKRQIADFTNLDGIFEGLGATGFAMQAYHDSRPASGAEHLCSHVWEMEGVAASHGFKVGLGTLATTLLMEHVFTFTREELAEKMTAPRSRNERECEVTTLLSKGIYGSAAAVAMAKFLEGEALERRRQLILDNWEALRRRVKAQLLPFAQLRRLLHDAGCPVTPEELGISYADFLHGIRTAQLIRKRYTILDVFDECGIMDEMLAILAPEFDIPTFEAGRKC